MNSTDEEDLWDEVEIPQPTTAPQSETVEIPLIELESHQPLDYNIEITLTKKGASTSEEQAAALAKKRQAAAHDRLIRLESHKLHAVALLASLSIRNKWLNDQVLKARLLSLVPLTIQHGFTSITKNAHPDPARRGRLFETALVRLASWFAPLPLAAAQNIHVERPSAGWFRITNNGHIKTHTFEAGVRRIQLLQKREAERKIRRAKRQEHRSKRAQARIKGKRKARDSSSSSSDDEDDDLEVTDSEDEWYAPERLRSPNSIAKHALQRSGSRDVAVLIFVAILRALGIPARLVSSLQCVPWSIPKDYTNKSRKLKGVTLPTLEQHEEGSGTEEVTTLGVSSRIGSPSTIGANRASSTTDRSADHSNNPTRLKEPSIKRKRGANTGGSNPISTIEANLIHQGDKASGGEPNRKDQSMRLGNGADQDSAIASPARPVIKLRRARPTGHVLGTAQSPGGGVNVSNDGSSKDGPPTLWAEVFSRPDGRWIPVDPVRGIVNRAGLFEQRDQVGKRKTDKLMYVVALEEDGYARDVTARYAKNFGAHQARARARIAAGRKNGKAEWWDSVMRILKRPYALHRDDVEDAELSHQRALEGLPSSIGAFKDHPIYALERHLRRDEAIHPRTEIAHFRGEPVFPRKNVLSLKPAEGWMRQGRILRQGMQPIKMAKARASTVRKKRELEIRREDEGEVMVGMYAEWQTELYKPPPVINGKIPTNDFGNIDLYVPTMLPEGAVHIPHKGCVKVARKLGISFAEAVTGFEFRKRQATPIITGIVIAAENEQVFMEALASHVHSEQLREATKRRERVLQRWTRLVQGLRIVQRVNEQYSGANHRGIDEAHGDNEEAVEPGGFLDDLKDVVRPYNLPQAQPIVPKLTIEEDRGVSEVATQTLLPEMTDSLSHTFSAPTENDEGQHEGIGSVICSEPIPSATNVGPPLTMQELADQLSKAKERANHEVPNDEVNRTASTTKPTLSEKESGQSTVEASLGVDDANSNSMDNGSDAKQDNVVQATPRLRRSSRRHNPPPSAPVAPTPTRTLRPRRKP